MNMSETFWKNDLINYAALAIPAFFLFLGLEYWIARRQSKKQLFVFESSIANITIGIAERLINLFITGLFYGVFVWLYERYAPWHIPDKFWVWIVLLFLTDLIWYWYHRLGHEINILWAVHIVHHQSEEFNYTVSARITTMQAIVRNVFWCVLPLMGFPPAMVITTLIIHGSYSFFTHTQVIRKLGWLEYILITPSHHRVHHASNAKYINKNYGDLFVFWDKLFGTFQKEEEEPVYGITHPLRSYSFIWQHVHYFGELFYACYRQKGLRAKLRLLFGSPDQLDQGIRNQLERRLIPERTGKKALHTFKAYLVVQVVVIVTILFVLALFVNRINLTDRVTASLFILITLINCGALLQQRRWIYYLEYIRLFVVISYWSIRTGSHEVWIISIFLITAFATSPILRRYYLKLIYGR